MNTKVKRLNKDQLKAVHYDKGSLLIIAGAGTGKTTVITERIKHFIIDKNISAENILALTFTEKASREMEERVDIALPMGYTQMWISTFHSFCDRILRDEALEIGLDPKYKLLTRAQSTKLIRDNIFKFDLNYYRPLGNPTRFISALLKHFSRLQDENISPDEYLKFAIEDNHKELARAYKFYDDLKIKNSYFDFGDLITKTLLLFSTRPKILKTYQQKFTHILVDEYQDTNIAQNELVTLLAKKHKQITVVLDDDQSIYRFRGAAISNALAFQKSFPKSKVISLTKNYRSTQTILDSAHKLIQFNNPDRLEVVENINKKLSSERKLKGKPIKFIHQNRVEDEAESVAQEIKKLIINHQSSIIEYRNIAILVRANAHADPFIRALDRAGIPNQFLGPAHLFSQEGVIDLISYLKILYDLEDSGSLFQLLSNPHFKINQTTLSIALSQSRKTNSSLFEILSKSKNKNIKLVLNIINKHIKLITKETAGQLLYFFLEDSSLIKKYFDPKTTEDENIAKNISLLFQKLKSYEATNPDAKVHAVVDWIDLVTELGEAPLASDSNWSDNDVVNILTIHSAKGLEFPIVFLVNLVSQRFPSMNRSEPIPIPEKFIKETVPQGDFHLQEERRLFYVGMTRAQDRLFLTAANYYGEAKRAKKLSPFIFETLGNKAVSAESTDNQNIAFSFSKEKRNIQYTKYNIPSTHVDYLSYSQIQSFQICPLHYKLRYILGLPTPPTAALSFGSSIHQTLYNYYKNPTDIVSLLKTSWINAGYINKDHEKKMYKRGEKYLKGYLKKATAKKLIP